MQSIIDPLCNCLERFNTGVCSGGYNFRLHEHRHLKVCWILRSTLHTQTDTMELLCCNKNFSWISNQQGTHYSSCLLSIGTISFFSSGLITCQKYGSGVYVSVLPRSTPSSILNDWPVWSADSIFFYRSGKVQSTRGSMLQYQNDVVQISRYVDLTA